MYPPRRKCRKLLVWIGLAVVAQVLFSLFLHGEFNFAPVRRTRITEKLDRIKSRFRLQSQDVDQMEGNHKFIARAKLEHARGKDESIDYEENLVISELKSTDLPRMPGRNLHNPLRVIGRNQAINLSAGIIERKGLKGKAIFDDRSAKKQTDLSRDFRTQNRRRSINTTLEDLFISVKTTGDYHVPRVSILLDTWFQNARKQVRLCKDGGHVVKTLLHFLHAPQFMLLFKFLLLTHSNLLFYPLSCEAD